MNNVEKKVDDLAELISKSLQSGSINSVLVEVIKSLESELNDTNEKLVKMDENQG
jgi:hypothetical protein